MTMDAIFLGLFLGAAGITVALLIVEIALMFATEKWFKEFMKKLKENK